MACGGQRREHIVTRKKTIGEKRLWVLGERERIW